MQLSDDPRALVTIGCCSSIYCYFPLNALAVARIAACVEVERKQNIRSGYIVVVLRAIKVLTVFFTVMKINSITTATWLLKKRYLCANADTRIAVG